MNVGRRRSEEQLPFSDVWELYKKVQFQKTEKETRCIFDDN